MKRAMLRVSDIFMMEFLKVIKKDDPIFAYKVENGLPSDTKIVKVGYDQTGTLLLLLESKEFEEASDEGGKPYPLLPEPIIKKAPIKGGGTPNKIYNLNTGLDDGLTLGGNNGKSNK